MKTDIHDALPGFVGLREFFRRLGETFEPVVLSDDRRDFYISKIEDLQGYPEDLFFNMKWAWRIDPQFRGARQYPNGVTMVRIGVGTFGSGIGLDLYTQNLLMAFDADDRLLQYTVLAGSGKLTRGANVHTYRAALGESAEHDAFGAAETFVKTMAEDDFLVIEDAEFPRQYLQVLAGIDGGKLVYAVEYCLEPFVLHFALPHHVDAEAVLGLIAIFKREGFASLQDAADWRQIDVDGYWESNGKSLAVDIGILAHIYRTEILKGNEAAKDMWEIFDTRSDDEKPLVVKVTYGTSTKMCTELFELTNDTQRFTDSQRLRILLYIQMVLRDAQGVE